MASARVIAVRFIGDASGLTRAANAGGAATSRFSDRTQKMAKVGLVAVGGLAVGFASFLKTGLGSLQRIEVIGAQTEAVLKSTAGAAGVTRAGIDDLAGSIEAFSGVEAESITEGQNLLLTFTGIKNAAGKGNDVFDQTTQIMADMSVAMGTAPKAAAIGLGKALNDPVKGVTALSKVGVSFTDKQKKMIGSLVDAGDTMGAQKIILAELNKEFGGSAKAMGETLTGRIERTKHAFGTMQESLAANLIPAMEKLTAWGLKISTWASENPGKVKLVVIVVGALAAVIGTVSAAIKVWTTVVRIATAVQKVWNAVMRQHPLVKIITVIGLLVAALVVCYKKFETFRFIVNGVIKAVGKAWLTYADAFLWGIEKMLGALGKLPGPLGAPFRKGAEMVSKMRGGIDTLKEKLDALPTSKRMQLKLDARAANLTLEQFQYNLDRATSSLGKAGLSGPVIPGRAVGGPVSAGRSYLVGERGPELFTPHGGGHITPNHELGGGGPEVLNLTLDLGHGIQQVVAINLREHDRAVKRTVGAGGRRTVRA